jgi:hypothetical protein
MNGCHRDAHVPGSKQLSDLEHSIAGFPAIVSSGFLAQWLATRREVAATPSGFFATTEQKRIASERETARRSHALAQVATVSAHEIREQPRRDMPANVVRQRLQRTGAALAAAPPFRLET